MKDRKGNEVKVGDRVFVLDRQGESAGAGWVRAIMPWRAGGEAARIDNGRRGHGLPDNNYTWSVWCEPKEFEVIL